MEFVPRDSFNREIDYLRLSVIDRMQPAMRLLHAAGGLALSAQRRVAHAGRIRDRRARRGQRGLSQISSDRRRTDAAPRYRRDRRAARSRARRQRPRADDQRAAARRTRARRSSTPASVASTCISTASNPATVERQMRWGSFEKIWRGIMAAEAAGLTPIKLNAVVTAGYNESDVVDAGAADDRARLARALHRADAAGRRRMRHAYRSSATCRISRRGAESKPRSAALTEIPSENLGRRVAQLSAARRARRGRIHQPGQRALLRDLQPDAPDGGRQVPSVPAQRRRARRAQSIALESATSNRRTSRESSSAPSS